ncbi:hypothetical protein KIW84_071783 [Lathyrus oleraceus]|uniref:Uncharacterized protein n=1 Tax=Pisum sativum TaxID=3888 RepID=A0A9D4ZTK1_PEA|nr:hypothetical protein KIW84_071783 [Pisum sativum]
MFGPAEREKHLAMFVIFYIETLQKNEKLSYLFFIVSNKSHDIYSIFVSANRIMDGSRVTESLDSLWFYTNVFTAPTHEPAVPSLTSPFSPSIHARSESSALEEQVTRKSVRESEKKERKKRRRRKIVAIVKQQNEMPPLEDDVAMKQHLKSWAYAVASHALSNKPISKVKFMNSLV